MRRTGERHTDEGHSRNEPVATGSPKVRTLADEKEADPHRLTQRQKQIDYGKNTIGYDRYCAQVPRHARRPGKHPMTPDKTTRMGKKVFDGVVRKWRQALHKYDPPELTETIKIIKTEATAQVASSDTNASTDISQATNPVADASASGAPTELIVKKKSSPIFGASNEEAPPSRSIYENFDEGNFDEDDSDDDLL
ncbi:hypothetical protein BBJ29_000624 [Phytophthora kernoviae]|uniref:Histone RNA hairpin-binding protein RNA-binding domain-containing protein n=1 Tax=Phytophthora kernoviae TaxID=325452 RepID=A0A3F2S136_9STRA|nr:hypothetical protein BBJ29_000624 [Phytophthora kernoviae]RLN67652.1 hypothetical protein BBP00_00001489 [Phytophthora kernoviae]